MVWQAALDNGASSDELRSNSCHKASWIKLDIDNYTLYDYIVISAV